MKTLCRPRIFEDQMVPCSLALDSRNDLRSNRNERVSPRMGRPWEPGGRGKDEVDADASAVIVDNSDDE